MAAPSSKTLVRRGAFLAVTILALLSTTGCEERNRLATEITKIRRETLELQPELVKAQAELNAVNKTYQNLRSHPAIRTSGPAYRKTVAEPPAAP
jgi:hypothetical protein